MHLVTGAGGFLGSRLVEALAASGEPVRAMFHGRAFDVPEGVGVALADLSDGAALRRAVDGCETVFHLAGKAHDLDPVAPDVFHSVNVEGTATLLQASVEAGVTSFVFVSSVKAMGEGAVECLDEESAPAPVSPYGRSKLEAERLVLEAGSRSGMRAAILRLPLVYGPGVKGNFRAMLDAIARGLFPPLPRVASRRSLVSVADVVQAARLVAASTGARGRLYLVTDGVTYTPRGIYDAMREALGKPRVSWSVPLPALRAAAALGDVASLVTGGRPRFGRASLEKLLGSACYRNDRLRRDLGFEPTTNLEAELPGIVRARARAT